MRLKVRYLLVGALVGAILICPAMAASPFPDVAESSGYAEAVEYLKDAGIVQGDDKGNFNPDKTVTRAEMATIICRMSEEESDSQENSDFSDVPVNHWANAYISKAVRLGIVNGYGNSRFGPSDNVTYEQAITMIIRMAGGDAVASEIGGYPDGYIFVASENGFLKGVQTKKGSPISRADIAMILFNYCSLISSADQG